MKKILIMAGVLIALIVANMIYNSIEKAQPDKKQDIQQQEAQKSSRLMPPGVTNRNESERNLESTDKELKLKKDFCLRAVKRMLAKGRTINILEFKQLSSVQNNDDLNSYYNCKAVEDINPRWCEPLKWIEKDVRPERQYKYCLDAYKYRLILRYLLIDSKNRMSIDELDKTLRDREDPFREQIIKNARLVLSEDPKDCDKVDEEFIGKFHCMIVKTGQAPETGEDEELRDFAGILPTIMKAIKNNDPQILQEFEGKDNKIPFFGLFSEEPYCDTAFEQHLKMKCQSY